MNRYGPTVAEMTKTFDKLRKLLIARELSKAGLAYAGDAVIAVIAAVGIYIAHVKLHVSFPELVVSAIVQWNTVYLSRAVAHLRQSGRTIPDILLKHVSPLSWEHINLTGIYSWDTEQQMPEGFRPLRLPGRILRAA